MHLTLSIQILTAQTQARKNAISIHKAELPLDHGELRPLGGLTRSAATYVPRLATAASLEELQTAAERVEKGVPLTPELDRALHHGTSIGGARPKALIVDGTRKDIAKFTAANDLYSVVKAEFVAMPPRDLPRRCRAVPAPADGGNCRDRRARHQSRRALGRRLQRR